jgi:hypothetical protein
MKDLSIILINWNSKDYLIDCISSIYKYTSNISYEMIVVDNASSDDSLKVLKETFPKVRIIANSKNLGLAKAYNQGIKQSNGKYIAILNVDILLTENSFDKAVSFLDGHENAAGTVCKSTDKEGTYVFQEGFRRTVTPFNLFLNDFFYSIFNRLFQNNTLVKKLFSIGCLDTNINQEVTQFAGSCMIFRKSIFDKTGLFDENFFLYCAEVDFTLRMINKEQKVYFLGETSIIHLGSKLTSLRKDQQQIYDRDYIHYFKKNFGNLSVVLYRLLNVPLNFLKYLNNLIK